MMHAIHVTLYSCRTSHVHIPHGNLNSCTLSAILCARSNIRMPKTKMHTLTTMVLYYRRVSAYCGDEGHLSEQDALRGTAGAKTVQNKASVKTVQEPKAVRFNSRYQEKRFGNIVVASVIQPSENDYVIPC